MYVIHKEGGTYLQQDGTFRKLSESENVRVYKNIFKAWLTTFKYKGSSTFDYELFTNLYKLDLAMKETDEAIKSLLSTVRRRGML